MTPDGYNRIKNALVDADINATVSPQPQFGEDIRFFDIKTRSDVPFAEVMNALGKAGLLLDECSDDYNVPPPAIYLVSNELRDPISAPQTSWRPDRYSTFEDYRAQR